jgi:hypothetical protein
MSVSKQELHELVDSLPDNQIPAMIESLSEMGDEEVIDPKPAAWPDAATAEPGDSISSEERRPVD